MENLFAGNKSACVEKSVKWNATTRYSYFEHLRTLYNFRRAARKRREAAYDLREKPIVDSANSAPIQSTHKMQTLGEVAS